jgi:hypothetical protein
VIPNGTHVRVNNVTQDPSLQHVHGQEGKVVRSYILPYVHPRGRRYLVCVNGLDYDLSYSELVVL